MYVKAELKCLNCGRPLGEATGYVSRPFSAATVTCSSGKPCFSIDPSSRPRCRFCGGRAIVESFETLPSAELVA